MEAEIIAGLLGNRSAFTKKYMRFISEDKKTTCEECKKYDKMVFAANDINKPTIPIHPNCRCYYQILYLDTTKKTAKFRVDEPGTGFSGETFYGREELLEKLETGYAPRTVTHLIIINHGEHPGQFELGSRSESFELLTDRQILRLKRHLAPNALIELRMCYGIANHNGEQVVQELANKLQCRIKAYANEVSPYWTRPFIAKNRHLSYWNKIFADSGEKIFYPQK